jgi:hypothetical protein
MMMRTSTLMAPVPDPFDFPSSSTQLDLGEIDIADLVQKCFRRWRFSKRPTRLRSAPCRRPDG